MKDKFKGKKDITITLDELLAKKGLTECMKKTRRMFYDWAKKTFQLYRLCNGDFDPFCDAKLCKDEATQQTCPANNNNAGGVVNNGMTGMQGTDVMPNTGWDGWPYSVFIFVIIAQTVVIMCLIYKRNNDNITYDYTKSVDSV